MKYYIPGIVTVPWSLISNVQSYTAARYRILRRWLPIIAIVLLVAFCLPGLTDCSKKVCPAYSDSDNRQYKK